MKKASLALSFFLCTIISAFIVLHSYQYLSGLLDATVAWLIALVIEVSYVCYNIMAVILGRWTKTDAAIKMLLFFLSVIPATMQTSNDTRRIFADKISLTAPTEPQNVSGLVSSYAGQLEKIDDEVEALRRFKTTYDRKKNDRSWYAFQDQKRIDKLMARRVTVDAKKKEIEESYLRKLERYTNKKASYLTTRTKYSFEMYFDLFFILWTVSVVWILQMVNGRLSGAISAHISGNDPTRNPVQKSASVAPEVLWAMLKHKPDTLPDDELKKILTLHSLTDYAGVTAFLNTDFQTAIKKKYPKNIREPLIAMFDGLRKEIGNSGKPAEKDNQPKR